MAPDNNNETTIKIKNIDGTWVTLGSVLNDFKVEINPIEYDRYYLGIWDNDDACDSLTYVIEDTKMTQKERNDTMNILEYYERVKRERIEKTFENIIEEDYKKLEVVDEYNTLINEFNINMEQLAAKYNTKDETILIPTPYENDYAYELAGTLRDDIRKKYSYDYERDMTNLHNFVEEVRAVLSISDDKDYQIEVLKNYEILDKKGKLNI